MARNSVGAAVLAGWVAWWAAGSAFGQQVVTDAAPFRRPAVFVPPDPPRAVLEQHGERDYRIDIEIDALGRVFNVAGVTPDDAEFRAQLAKVLKWWVFYPRVDAERCAATTSQGRVEIRYRRGEKGPRIWLTLDPLDALVRGVQPSLVHKPAAPPYPWRERRVGREGDVFVLLGVGADGSVQRAELLLSVPESRGFIETALEHAKGLRWDAGMAERRCVAIHYKYILR